MVHGQEPNSKKKRKKKENPGPTVHDEALAFLLDSSQDGQVHIPTFARRTLEQLRDVGLLRIRDDVPPANMQKVKWAVEGKDQDLWVRFDTRRAATGYLTVEVVDAPRLNAAILAAMTTWVFAQQIDLEQLGAAMRFRMSQAYKEQVERAEAVNRKLREDAEHITREE